MFMSLLLLLLPQCAMCWRSVSVEDFGAVGDNRTDCTSAFRAAFAAVDADREGGEVVVPAGHTYRTGPVNISSNTVFRVEGTMRAIQNRSVFPKVAILPSVGHDYDTNGPCRRHPFVWVHGSNFTLCGHGTIDGAGRYWWNSTVRRRDDPGVGRPHLLELYGVKSAEVRDITLLNSAFWTFHPVYTQNLHVHHITIQIPWGGFNGDGIDVDSSQNVLIEHNYLNVGDDHVTVLAGVGDNGRMFPGSRNITVVENRLGTGMGLSVGSSVSGGVQDVLFARNWMNETAGEWGIGMHVKTRTTYGGFIHNVAYLDNWFETAGYPGGAIQIECGYQSGHGNSCSYNECTEIRDIVFRNNTFKRTGGTGQLVCFPARPCHNITLEDVVLVNHTTPQSWGCQNVASGTFRNVQPSLLANETKNCSFSS